MTKEDNTMEDFPQSESAKQEEMTPELAKKIAELKKENAAARVEGMGMPIGELKVRAIQKVIEDLENQGELKNADLTVLEEVYKEIGGALEEITSEERGGLDEAEAERVTRELMGYQAQVENARTKKIQAA